MRLRPFLLGFVVLLLDCAALDKLPEQTCGNGVIDANEDCDTFPNDPNDTTRARCGTPTEGDAACHLRCGLQPSGVTLTCPDGWGCNVNGICREPTGEFSKALGAVSGGVTELSVGDFDGDGRRDLVGSGPRNRSNASRLRVHFFDDAGTLTQVAALPGQGVAPVVFDHDHNGRDDIAFGIVTSNGPGALAVVSGLADKTFLPVVFPSVSLADTEAAPFFVFPQYADVKLPNGNTDDAILIIARDKDGPALKSLEGELGGGSRLDRPLPVGPEAIRGRPGYGRLFDGNPLSTCGEIVVAVQTPSGGALYVLSPCTYTQLKPPDGAKLPRWDDKSADGFETIALPALADDSRGVLVADIDGDGHLDVLVDTKDGPYVAYGDPTGTSLLPATRWNPRGVASAMPLAVGDLTGDGKADFVFSSSVAVAVPDAPDAGADAGAGGPRDGTFVSSKQDASVTWTDAAIGHFNADAYVDIVTAHEGAPDIQLYAGGPEGSTFTTVTTDGIVQAIEKGDFDGDHIEDIAITQATSVVGISDVSIAYGRAFGGLEPPRRIGSVDKPRGIRVVPHGSSPSDLGMYSYDKEKAGHALHSTSFTLLNGSGDRQPVAPLFFVDNLSCSRTVDPCLMPRAPLPATSARAWFPLGLAAGAFVHQDQSSVLAYTLGITLPAKAGDVPALGAWSADANDVPGGLSAPTERQVLDGQFDVFDEATRGAKIATTTGDVDLLPDGLDEIVATTNLPGSGDGLLLVVHPAQQGSPAGTVLPGLQVVPGAQLALADLDGDGYRDAIGFFGTAPDGQVVVFLNDQKGHFVVPGIRLVLAAPPPGAPGEGNPIAFAPLAVRGAPVAAPVGTRSQTNALAVLTEHSVVIATLRPDKQGFDTKSLAAMLGGNGVTGATGIAAGDFNGDGVDDIAVANGTIRLLLQTPARSAK